MSKEKITLQVDGMSCSHCSGMVHRTLEAISGISDVQVDLEGKKASFMTDNTSLVDTAIKEVTEAGYKAAKS